jgi:hypothetical protein
VKSVSSLLTLCLIVGTEMVAQNPQPAAAPTPQQQMMGYFAGYWTLSGTARISPSGPATPFTATEHSEWVPGNYFLETHTKMHGPMGDVHSTRVLEYNPADKVYTYNAYNSLGEHTMAEGTVQGKTWIWNAEEKLNGVVTKGRYTVTFISPDSYGFKSEVPKAGGGWATVMEGTATRSQPQSQ